MTQESHYPRTRAALVLAYREAQVRQRMLYRSPSPIPSDDEIARRQQELIYVLDMHPHEAWGDCSDGAEVSTAGSGYLLSACALLGIHDERVTWGELRALP